MPAELPSVSSVIATRGRPELLRRAVRSIASQTYDGAMQIVVVFDQGPVDPLDDIRAELLGNDRKLELLTVANARTPGLAGGRNTGVEASWGEFVAFCDDDDEWHADKLQRQVALLAAHPEAICASGAIDISTATTTTRRVPPAVVDHADFLRSRVAEIHPSTLLFPRARVRSEVGLVDEELPFGYGEDYDFLLRLSAAGEIVSVQQPVAIIHWDRTSFFASRWQGMAAGLSYLLAKHGQLLTDRRNGARISGQVAFAHAAAGGLTGDADVRKARQAARDWARRSIRQRPTEFRGWIALAVASAVVPAELVLKTLNKFGRGV